MQDKIEAEIRLGPAPLPRAEVPHGAPAVDAHTGRTGTAATLRASVREEYVAGSALNISSGFAESLPPYIDEITREFGTDVYDRMYKGDAHIAGTINGLMFGALSGGWSLQCAVTLTPGDDPEENPEYRLAEEIRRFVETDLKSIRFFDLLQEFARACYQGHKVAEIVYRSGPDGRLHLDRIKPKERTAYSFVVDNRKTVIGLLANLAGRMTTQITPLSLVDVEQQANLLPREKFAVFTFRPENNDPRGVSLLRACYNAWWLKMQSLAEYHKFLCIAATPSLLGVLPENARDGVDENGQALTAEKAMSQALAGLANNSAIVVGHGGDVRPVFLQENDGAAFLKAFEYYDKQMTVAITSQALATADSQHASKAAGVEQKTIWDMVVEDLETGIAMTVQEDIIRPLVAYNWGEEIAEKYAPKFSMSAVEEADFGALAEGFSKLTGVDIIQPEHLPYVWAKLGLPVLRQGKRPAGRRNVA